MLERGEGGAAGETRPGPRGRAGRPGRAGRSSRRWRRRGCGGGRAAGRTGRCRSANRSSSRPGDLRRRTTRVARAAASSMASGRPSRARQSRRRLAGSARNGRRCRARRVPGEQQRPRRRSRAAPARTRTSPSSPSGSWLVASTRTRGRGVEAPADDVGQRPATRCSQLSSTSSASGPRSRSSTHRPGAGPMPERLADARPDRPGGAVRAGPARLRPARLPGDLHGEAGLADPGRPGDGEEPVGVQGRHERGDSRSGPTRGAEPGRFPTCAARRRRPARDSRRWGGHRGECAVVGQHLVFQRGGVPGSGSTPSSSASNRATRR